jgi:ribosomal protein S12 methylthiotransferase accessory factor
MKVAGPTHVPVGRMRQFSAARDTEFSVHQALSAFTPGLRKSFGLLDSVQRVPHYTDELQFFHFGGKLSSTTRMSDGSNMDSYAYGFSLLSEETALIKFIGEAAERFCLQIYKEKKFTRAAYCELGQCALDPLTINGVSVTTKQLLPRFDVTVESVLRWTRATDLLTGTRTLVPAQLVYLSYQYPDWEKMIHLPITTGAAAGSSVYAAVYRGLCEIIERDAFLIYYLNKLSPQQIDLSLVDDPFTRTLLRKLARYRLEPFVFDITTDLTIPTCLAVVVDPSGIGPPVSLGLRAGTDAVRIIGEALLESQHPRSWIRRLMEEGETPPESPRDIVSLADRALFWAQPERQDDLAFLWQGGRAGKVTRGTAMTAREQLQRVLDRLRERHLSAYVVDLTLPRIRRLGLAAVKVIAPQLVPFYLRENVPYLGARRLYDAPVRMGRRTHPLTENELNHIPHPFL